MKGLVRVLTSLDRALTAVLKGLTIGAFVALALIVTANIVLRFLPFTSLHWLDEIVEMLFAALVFYGAAGVWMVKGHFSVGDWFGSLTTNERARGVYRLLLELLTLLFAAVLLYTSSSLVMRSIEATAVFQIPKKVLYSCMPASALIMVAYSIVRVVSAAIETAKPGGLSAARPSE